jgi:VCBS repeat-containing protein
MSDVTLVLSNQFGSTAPDLIRPFAEAVIGGRLFTGVGREAVVILSGDAAFGLDLDPAASTVVLAGRAYAVSQDGGTWTFTRAGGGGDALSLTIQESILRFSSSPTDDRVGAASALAELVTDYVTVLPVGEDYAIIEEQFRETSAIRLDIRGDGPELSVVAVPLVPSNTPSQFLGLTETDSDIDTPTVTIVVTSSVVSDAFSLPDQFGFAPSFVRIAPGAPVFLGGFEGVPFEFGSLEVGGEGTNRLVVNSESLFPLSADFDFAEAVIDNIRLTGAGVPGERTVTVSLIDPDGNTTSQELVVGVEPFTAAVDDSVATSEWRGVKIDILANDFTSLGGTLSVTGVDTSGTLGTVVALGDGVLAYRPGSAFDDLEAGDTATDSFVYTVSDGLGGVASATVAVVIEGDSLNIVDGAAGLSEVDGTAAADRILGAASGQLVRAGEGDDLVLAAGGDDTVHGDGGADELFGSAGNDVIIGGDGADRLRGGAGNDSLSGGRQDDVLIGGTGSDTLAGGTQRDRFVFNDISHSPAKAPDTVMDFAPGRDVIVLTRIDAIAGGSDDAFTFVGDGPFAGAGSLRAEQTTDGTVVSADVDGDDVAVFSLLLLGALSLTAADFAL